jgi:hypothetical protein
MSLKHYTQMLAAFAAVFAFSAMAAGAAQASAPRWTVGGATPLANLSLPFTGKSTGAENSKDEQAKEVGTLEVPGLFTLKNPKDKCTVTGRIVGSAALSPGTNKEVVLHCEGVEFTSAGLNAACVVHSPGKPDGTIATEKLESRLVWLASTGTTHVGDRFESEASTGGPLVSLEIAEKPGKECILTGMKFEVKGCVIGTMETPNTDKETQAINFPTPPITNSFDNKTPTPRNAEPACSLTVGGKAAQFTNTFDLTLNSQELWGVEPG